MFFLDRDLKFLLPTDTRPLAATAEDIKKRYAERIGTYISSADIRVLPRRTPEGTAQIILKEAEENT